MPLSTQSRPSSGAVPRQLAALLRQTVTVWLVVLGFCQLVTAVHSHRSSMPTSYGRGHKNITATSTSTTNALAQQLARPDADNNTRQYANPAQDGQHMIRKRRGIFGKVWRGIKKVGGKIKKGAQKVTRGIKKFGGKIKKGAQKVGRGIKKFGGKIKKGAKKVVRGVKKAVNSCVGRAVIKGIGIVNTGLSIGCCIFVVTPPTAACCLATKITSGVTGAVKLLQDQRRSCRHTTRDRRHAKRQALTSPWPEVTSWRRQYPPTDANGNGGGRVGLPGANTTEAAGRRGGDSTPVRRTKAERRSPLSISGALAWASSSSTSCLYRYPPGSGERRENQFRTTPWSYDRTVGCGASGRVYSARFIADDLQQLSDLTCTLHETLRFPSCINTYTYGSQQSLVLRHVVTSMRSLLRVVATGVAMTAHGKRSVLQGCGGRRHGERRPRKGPNSGQPLSMFERRPLSQLLAHLPPVLRPGPVVRMLCRRHHDDALTRLSQGLQRFTGNAVIMLAPQLQRQHVEMVMKMLP